MAGIRSTNVGSMMMCMDMCMSMSMRMFPRAPTWDSSCSIS